MAPNFYYNPYALEKEMATHSSVLAWRIKGMGEPGGLPSVGSHRVGHEWNDLAAETAYAIIPLNECYTEDAGSSRESSPISNDLKVKDTL